MAASPAAALTIFLLGDVASGKATHSQRLAKKYGYFDFDMGKELRLLDARQPKLSLVKEINLGHLAPTAAVRSINRRVIAGLQAGQGIVFDGHPKMVGEARLAVQQLAKAGRSPERTMVLYLHVPRAETLRRMSGRTEIGANGKPERRADDTAAALRNRLRYYRKNVAPTLQFLKKHFYFKRISAVGSVAEVSRRIDLEIKKFIERHARND